MNLVVGPLDADTTEALVDEGVSPADERWRAIPAELAEISLLNLSTVGSFLEHAKDLMGREMTFEAAAKCFPNLPWYEPAVWLPADLAPRRLDTSEAFVGSSAGLLRDLEAIRDLSPIAFGGAPAGYAAMRADPIAFARTEGIAIPYPDYLQWVWFGLHDAATVSLSSGAAISTY